MAKVVAVMRMSNIDTELMGVEIRNDETSREGAAMTTNLHVSFPDKMRTNGENKDTTPSEYVRTLIREDVAGAELNEDLG